MKLTDPDINRIRWQCRRGMLELDLLLMEFLDNGYSGLNGSARQDFIRLLTYPDQSLQRWLLGDAEDVTSEMQRIVQIIRARGVDQVEPG